MRLDKFLHDIGLGSRKELGQAIRQGRVTVDGDPVYQRDFQVGEEALVTFDGDPLSYQDAQYLMVHKPAGVVTAMRDGRDQTVMDLLFDQSKNLRPVGRLDKDTTGLLLLTTDGQLAHRLASPKYDIPKTYCFTYSGDFPLDAVDQVARGLDLSDGPTRPAKLDLTGPGQAQLTLSEGRTHQVKRMCHALGGEVLALHRVQLGPLWLDDLPEGQWRRLSPEEIAALYAACGLNKEAL